MRRMILLIVLVSLFAVPVVMAIDGCSGMGSPSGAPCSAPYMVAPTVAADPMLVPIASLAPPAPARIPFVALRKPDAPPKSLHSA